MKKEGLFKAEFNRRYKSSDLTVYSAPNWKDYIITNESASKIMIVTMVYEDYFDIRQHKRFPPPQYSAEAVILFRFRIDDSEFTPNVLSFIYENPVLKRTEFLNIRSTNIKEILQGISGKPWKARVYEIILWVFPDDFLFVANNLSGEGEWYLLGGLDNHNDNSCCMAKGSERDLSGYLNQWREIDEFVALKK